MRGPRVPVAVFRIALVMLCALLSLLPPRHGSALPVLLVLALGAWGAFRSPRWDRPWPYAGAAIAAAATPWTGGEHSPLLPYLLAPGLTLGLTRGVRSLILAAGSTSGALLIASTLPRSMTGSAYFVTGAEWVLLSLAVGFVAIWARRLATAHGDDYLEVRQLLEQLRNLTRQLPGGLDAASAAEVLLDRCAKFVPKGRSAVVVRPTGGAFVPVAVRGGQRVPWRAPLAEDGPLRRAWETQRPVLDRRAADTAGRRQGSALLTLPLLSAGKPFGLVILESYETDAFTESDAAELQALVAVATPQLETALLFEEVRLAASTQERDRLAREMHDGIAQELAFIGYGLDSLRQRAVAVDPELAAAVVALRRDLTTLISDIRLSITDLRTTVNPERGLGAALSAYLRAVCSGKEVLLNLSLQESAFRLPPEQEVLLFKAAQVFAQDVRRAADVRTLTVRLVVDPPSASLHLSSDGPFITTDLGDIRELLTMVGAQVATSQGSAGGPCLEIELKGGPDDYQRPAGRRPRADSAGAEAGVRSD